MPSNRLFAYIAFVCLSCLAAIPVLARQATPKASQTTLTVFLDCDRCDDDYIRDEIKFVNYVRDRTEAQVHLLITTQRAGSGREYTLNFIGRDHFAGINDTLRYVSSSTDTDDERRAGLVRSIKLGLVRYVAHTPQASGLSIGYNAGEQASRQTTPAEDPWNSWVFQTSIAGSFQAEESTDFLELEGDLSASRITERWKSRFSLSSEYRESNFDLGDELIRSTSRSGRLRTLVVRSLGRHWAAGGFASISTSSFNNTDLSISVSPAIEYNVFPYDQSTRREFRISYFLNFRAFDYEEQTVFGKNAEAALHHELEVSLEVTQPWGEAEASLEFSNYLYDFDTGRDMLDFYQVELFGFVQFRVIRGLSVFAHGGVSWIRDQLSLPASEASEEDILLRNRRLPTSYEVNLSLGLSYTFGSIYNNIVNPRFGS